MIEDYQHPDLRFDSGTKMQLDIYVQDLHLAFEYQGQHHYHNLYSFGPQDDSSYRDEQKRKACSERGITLIEVPYWLDFHQHSLAGTIKLKRSELIQEAGEPINPCPPLGPIAHGEFSTRLALAESWDQKRDLTGW